MNILIGGLGTIFIGILRIVENGSFCHKFKYILYGIIQAMGYLLALFSICLFKSKIKIECIFLLFGGICCYAFSFYTSYKYYKKITSWNNVLNNFLNLKFKLKFIKLIDINIYLKSLIWKIKIFN